MTQRRAEDSSQVSRLPRPDSIGTRNYDYLASLRAKRGNPALFFAIASPDSIGAKQSQAGGPRQIGAVASTIRTTGSTSNSLVRALKKQLSDMTSATGGLTW